MKSTHEVGPLRSPGMVFDWKRVLTAPVIDKSIPGGAINF